MPYKDIEKRRESARRSAKKNYKKNKRNLNLYARCASSYRKLKVISNI